MLIARSFGIILWEIVTLKEPYEDITTYPELKRRVCKVRLIYVHPL